MHKLNSAAVEFIPSTPIHTASAQQNVDAAVFIPSASTASAEQPQFDEMFPSLRSVGGGGTVTPAPINASAPVSAEPGLLEKQRLKALKEKFPWVLKAKLQQLLAVYGYGYQANERYVLQHYPKPPGYGAAQKSAGSYRPSAPARRRGAPRPSASASTPGAVSHRCTPGYASRRGFYARRRNDALERSDAAKRSGNYAEAARLSAEGRHYEALMFEKQKQAANAIFNERNPTEKLRHCIVDLHVLHISEALDCLRALVRSSQAAQLRNHGLRLRFEGTGTVPLRPTVVKWYVKRTMCTTRSSTPIATSSTLSYPFERRASCACNTTRTFLFCLSTVNCYLRLFLPSLVAA